MSTSTGGEASTLATIADTCPDAGALPRLINHIRNPDHLIAYLVFTAWAKYMDIFSWIPTVTIGG